MNDKINDNFFDEKRRYIPLHFILTKEEMEDDIRLCRILAIYDTINIKHKSKSSIIGLFIETKSGNSKKLSHGKTCISERKRKRRIARQAVVEMCDELMKSYIYKKLVSANWFPEIYCGDKSLGLKFTKRRR